jgi:(5-formylfuran-3-yl)methyl phosphate transaminase
MSRISKKSLEVPPFYVMEILERAFALEREGRDIVHLEVGEPDFDTPPCIRAGGARALDQGDTHYTHSLGKLELREAICAWHERRYGTCVAPDRVIVTSGTSPALMLVFMTLCDPGDEVIISNPHYACYPNIISFSGGTPVRVPVFEEDGFAYRPDAIREAITKQTKAILLNSPSNPTGMVLPDDTLRAIAACGVLPVSDEIYHGLIYAGPENSMLQFTDDCVVINGFSKLFAMTGWRLGYAIVPPDLIRPMQKMQQNFFISAPSMAQRAGIAALQDCRDEVLAMRDEYARRRLLVLKRLREMGFPMAVEPVGAFYAFVNVKEYCRRTGNNSLELAYRILETSNVAVTPGTDFGPGGEGYIRLSYATRYDRLEEGLRRLERFFAAV